MLKEADYFFRSVAGSIFRNLAIRANWSMFILRSHRSTLANKDLSASISTESLPMLTGGLAAFIRLRMFFVMRV